MSGSLKKSHATAIRGLTRPIALPNAGGAVWIWVPTSNTFETGRMCGPLQFAVAEFRLESGFHGDVPLKPSWILVCQFDARERRHLRDA